MTQQLLRELTNDPEFLAYDEKVHRAAFSLLVINHFDFDPDSEVAALYEWKRRLAGLEKAPWADGGHYGNCTDVPMLCLRCEMQDVFSNASNLLYVVENGLAQDRDYG